MGRLRTGPVFAFLIVGLAFAACGGGDGANGGGSGPGGGDDAGGVGAGDGAVTPSDACRAAGGTAPVQQPTFVRNLKSGETGWYASPAAVDLDGDGKKEVVAPFYSTFVFDGATGAPRAKATATKGRVYAPGVVADLDGDGVTEVVVGGNEGTIAAYEYKAGALALKSGWASASTCSAGQCPETRGMAAGDLDGDGKIEVVATTTNTATGGAQVFVFEPDGKLRAGWPRYDTLTPGDADFNGAGNHGYGCYGENVGIGNIDDDPQLEILVTYDDHQINAFDPDGSSLLASDWYTNPSSDYLGKRMGWGQFIRWLDPQVEDVHYHDHGVWPDVKTTMWLQWTASPVDVADVNGDGKNEVIGFPNAEEHEPYETQGYALTVLEGAQGGGARAARRLAGFETLPMSDKPPAAAEYPPIGIPAPTAVNLVGDARPEILASLDDGYVYAFGPDASRLWRYDFRKGRANVYASEVVVADLNRDGAPEVVFGTYGSDASAASLVVLANTGALLYEIPLTGSSQDPNGVGVPAAPTVADLDGDGALEILLTTFDHGVDVFTVPGSGDNCLLWPTGRGGPLRNGSGPSTAR